MANVDGVRKELRSTTCDVTTHAGLWLDKFLGHGTQDKDQAIRTLFREALSIEVPEGYTAALERRRTLLAPLTGGVDGGITRTYKAKALGRIVVGLGAQSARETNIALLHTWGVPYIPGSALKGLAAAAAHRHASDECWRKANGDRPQGDEHRTLFGDTTCEGCVVFHDAWWVPTGKALPLDLDTMTVHHADYYGGGAAPPADCDEPNPVAFITAQGAFLVSLSGPARWIDVAAEWLVVGLARDGIGAKTAAGYGRMELERQLSDGERRDKAERQAIVNAAAEAKRNLDERCESLRRLAAQHRGSSTARQHVLTLREARDKKGVPEDRLLEVADAFYGQAPAFWEEWGKAEKQLDLRDFLIAIGLVGRVRQVAVPASDGAPRPAPAVPVASWTVARAWIAVDRKNHAILFVRVDGDTRLLERKVKDAKPTPALEAQLKVASPEQPLEVEIELKGDKIQSVRARPA